VRNETSLRQLIKQLGVSSSYLSQVNTGKRPPSARVLSNADVRRVLSAKHEVDVGTCRSYNSKTCQRSSGVEQRFRKPSVVGSNPTAG
jgi:DNA-binding transcriptional regulator YdaS (Cro superfamily)